MWLTFVRVDGLEVHAVSDDVVLVADAVAAEHVAALAGDVERFAARVALDERDHLRGSPVRRRGVRLSERYRGCGWCDRSSVGRGWSSVRKGTALRRGRSSRRNGR